jgi:prevent-host-death family protein
MKSFRLVADQNGGFMDTVGSYEAKTKLSRLLENAAKGRRTTITKHGVPIAEVIPASGGRKKTVKEIIAGIKELRKEVKPGKMSIKQMIEEGRRF